MLAVIPIVWLVVLWALSSDLTVNRLVVGTIRTVLGGFAGISFVVALIALMTDLDSRLQVTSRGIIHKLGRPWPRVLLIPYPEIEHIRLEGGAVRIKRRAVERWIDLGKDWKEFPAIEKALRSRLGAKIS